MILVFIMCVCSQSCLILCDPMDYSPPSSSVHGIFQARILELVAILYSGGSSQPRDQTGISSLLHWQADTLPLSHQKSPIPNAYDIDKSGKRQMIYQEKLYDYINKCVSTLATKQTHLKISKDMNRHFTRRHTDSKHMKRCHSINHANKNEN